MNIVISGITGGIGGAIAAYLLASLTPSPTLLGLTRRLLDDTGMCHYYCVNPADPEDIAVAAQSIFETYGPCDALIMAHGHSPVTDVTLSLSPARFTDVLQTDVAYAFLLAQTFGRQMVEQRRGNIIAISSLHARQTYPARAPYAASKAAVCGMMRSLALEWGPHGVRCNTILPWQVAGQRTDAFIAEARKRGENLEEAYLARCPARQFVSPEDIGRTVEWLINTPSVNGAEIVLDGGVSASMWHKGYEKPYA